MDIKTGELFRPEDHEQLKKPSRRGHWRDEG